MEFEPEKKKKKQESEDDWRATLNKRNEWARARQELARLVMRTIFLVAVRTSTP